MSKETPQFDLAERTAAFGEQIIDLCLELPSSSVSSPLINQLVRSGTSIGANYSEADEAESKRDFRHKIALCRKEARESKYWCRLTQRACPNQTNSLRLAWQEAHELNLIFAKIIRTTDENLRKKSPHVHL